MGRNKILHKNINISISLLEDQIDFINSHKDFNISKFVQIHLRDHMTEVFNLEEIQKEVLNHDKKTIR